MCPLSILLIDVSDDKVESSYGDCGVCYGAMMCYGDGLGRV